LNARRYIALVVALALSSALIVGVANSAAPGYMVTDDQSEPGITLGKDMEDVTGDDDRWGSTSVWTGDDESSGGDDEENDSDHGTSKGPDHASPQGVLRHTIRTFFGTVWIFVTCAL